ncbi:HupE/UreJ family protein [Algoriphagus sp. SE2]|uniref:HupE/UreJ family protein n=1 Tax=Algoriphagus sp. SE2 TaxID=3141536 RepID=UPI0031CD2653
MKRYLFIGLLFFILGFSTDSWAHEIRPAYLQIKQISENSYQVLWKVPRKGDMVISLQPIFSENFTLTEASERTMSTDALVFHFNLEGSSRLPGSQLTINNLEKTMVDVLVNIEYLNGEKITLMLKPDQPQILLPGKTSKWGVVKTYSILGIEHILFGFDHLLFVLALLIISVGFKKLLKTVTAFTIAHSITLSFSVLGIANLPGPPVEAVIALSIVFLAMEIIKLERGTPTLTSKKPWLVAFSFGLLHGFGFAGALSDIGLPQTEIPLALAFFNIGVELGQIIFVIVASGAMSLLAIKKDWSLAVKQIPAYTLGSIAAFWTIERIVGFWF